MEISKFTKNDESFECKNCGARVERLGYTSRDHCPKCLASLHVDINPGDRLNDCCGLMLPISVKPDNKKNFIIEYKCSKCGKKHNNKSASDDSFETILSVMNDSYENRLKKLLNKKSN